MTATSAPSAYEEIRQHALVAIERDRLDPVADARAVAEAVTDAVAAYQQRAELGGRRALADPDGMTARIVAAIVDHGPFTELLARPDVEEIFIEGPQVAYLDVTGRLHGLAVPTSEEENLRLIDRLLAATSRRLDATSPLVQARILEGTARLTAAIPPVADHLSATIRRHLLRRETLTSLIGRGSLTEAAAGLLWAAMQTTASVVVSGPPGAGKTSLLAALMAAAPSSHCIRCCEEIRELSVPVTHGSYYEARPPALDGSGEISLRHLVKFSLAMRPDRLVVGEVRGSEAFELTRAVNAGCGVALTVHANSARDALSALVNAAIMAGENVRDAVVRRVFAGAIDLVVHLDRDDPARSDPQQGIRRQVMEIIGVVPSLTDDFSTEPLFLRPELGTPLLWTGVLPAAAERLERVLPEGMTLPQVLEGRGSPL